MSPSDLLQLICSLLIYSLYCLDTLDLSCDTLYLMNDNEYVMLHNNYLLQFKFIVIVSQSCQSVRICHVKTEAGLCYVLCYVKVCVEINGDSDHYAGR